MSFPFREFLEIAKILLPTYLTKRPKLQPGNASSRALRSSDMLSFVCRCVLTQEPSRYPSAVL